MGKFKVEFKKNGKRLGGSKVFEAKDDKEAKRRAASFIKKNAYFISMGCKAVLLRVK